MGKETPGNDVDTDSMTAKLAAAKIAMGSGLDMMIANGEDVGVIYRTMARGEKGILFMAHGSLDFDLTYYIYNEC